MRILVIEPERPATEKEIDGLLKSMQEIVGGTIQAVYPFADPVALICNDEGKLLNLPPNRALREEHTGIVYDVVAGTFFLCGVPAEEENFASLTDEQTRKYKRKFSKPEVFLQMGGRLLVIPCGE